MPIEVLRVAKQSPEQENYLSKLTSLYMLEFLRLRNCGDGLVLDYGPEIKDESLPYRPHPSVLDPATNLEHFAVDRLTFEVLHFLSSRDIKGTVCLASIDYSQHASSKKDSAFTSDCSQQYPWRHLAFDQIWSPPACGVTGKDALMAQMYDIITNSSKLEELEISGSGTTNIPEFFGLLNSSIFPNLKHLRKLIVSDCGFHAPRLRMSLRWSDYMEECGSQQGVKKPSDADLASVLEDSLTPTQKNSLQAQVERIWGCVNDGTHSSIHPSLRDCIKWRREHISRVAQESEMKTMVEELFATSWKHSEGDGLRYVSIGWCVFSWKVNDQGNREVFMLGKGESEEFNVGRKVPAAADLLAGIRQVWDRDREIDTDFIDWSLIGLE